MSAIAEEMAEGVKEFALKNAVRVPRVEAFYDSTQRMYAMQNSHQRWLMHPSQQFKMLLKTSQIAESVNDAELLMSDIINTRDVCYTGRLAGHPAGFYEANGVRMLVTEGPRILMPKTGEWPTIHRLIDGLLGACEEHGELQVTTFCHWIRSGFESIASAKWRPGQILALAGPVACGKSLAQRLATECFGGRSADAFRYLSGNSQFNRDLFEAEHLCVDDAQASTDYRTRLQMAANLKGIATGRDHSCHGKGRDAVNLRPLWRCSMSLNDEGECLLVLPPLRADIADKLHLLKCHSPREPFPTGTPAAMDAYWERLTSELPAFLHYCCQLAAPAGRGDARFGIKAFHHPSLVMALEEQSPEIVLLELIDLELWNSIVTEWDGTARELEARLTAGDSRVREQARKLLSWPNACGTFLGRLSTEQPDRVRNDRNRERRGWIVRKARSVTP